MAVKPEPESAITDASRLKILDGRARYEAAGKILAEAINDGPEAVSAFMEHVPGRKLEIYLKGWDDGPEYQISIRPSAMKHPAKGVVIAEEVPDEPIHQPDDLAGDVPDWVAVRIEHLIALSDAGRLRRSGSLHAVRIKPGSFVYAGDGDVGSISCMIIEPSGLEHTVSTVALHERN